MIFTLPPEIEAQFHTERSLKHTDSGRVLLLRHKRTGERRICKQFMGDSAVCRLLTQVQCPHLPRMEAVWEEDGIVTTLEEYIQGDTLAALLECSPLSQQQSRDILLQLCRGLGVLHDLGIIHRDIKPENVILRGNTAVLIDFNASRTEKAPAPHDTVLMGTAGYAAPEQYGFAQTDARSDIYAMGVLLNIMLTGQHPAVQLAEGSCGTVVQGCTEVNADRRYQTAAALAAALEHPKQPKKRLHLAWLLCILGAILLLAALPRGASDTSAESNRIGPMAFRWDANGDGIEEDYLFGVGFAMPDAFGEEIIYHDKIGLEDETNIPSRTVVANVWGKNLQGEWVVCPDLCAMLTHVSITVHKEQDPNAAPKITQAEPRSQGAILVEFTPDPIGTWVYTATAKLGDLSLTASTATQIVLNTAVDS